MYRKLQLLVAPLILLLIAGSLYVGRERLVRLGHIAVAKIPHHGPAEPAQTHPNATAVDQSNPVVPLVPVAPVNATAVDQSNPVVPVAPVADERVHILVPTNLTTYVEAVLGREPIQRPILQLVQLPTLECPAINATRYKTLQVDPSSSEGIQYYFTLNLRQNLLLLPRLLGSIVEAIRFLGPKHCILSIVEGNSHDGTPLVLEALRPGLEALGITYFFESSLIDPKRMARIVGLAQLRNLAMKPLIDHPERAGKDAVVVFFNDVAACPDDILELTFQRKHLNADMTCAMDWVYVENNITFYDSWIARGINGDAFFRVPPDSSWKLSWNLFWNAEETRTRYQHHRPFQVFSCWNGGAVFRAKPILEKLRFRAPTPKECLQGEPQLFCKDLWHRGYGKIAVVPTVNLQYSVEEAKTIKKAKGFVSDLVANQSLADDLFEWRLNPPKSVRCMPKWEHQFWEPWNEGLE